MNTHIPSVRSPQLQPGPELVKLIPDMLLQYPSRTPELYTAKIAPLIEKAMNGFNTTVFAYGATASGKSHTMVRSASETALMCADRHG
jgi:Cdc6-like AAA superfamily ATPase